jgi:hypothetical protein
MEKPQGFYVQLQVGRQLKRPSESTIAMSEGGKIGVPLGETFLVRDVCRPLREFVDGEPVR